jgi:hypothetical protein
MLNTQMIASDDDLTTKVVPRDGWAPLLSDGDVEFDYTVPGVLNADGTVNQATADRLGWSNDTD